MDIKKLIDIQIQEIQLDADSDVSGPQEFYHGGVFALEALLAVIEEHEEENEVEDAALLALLERAEADD